MNENVLKLINKIPADDMKKLKKFNNGDPSETLMFSETIDRIKKECNLSTEQVSSIFRYFSKK